MAWIDPRVRSVSDPLSKAVWDACFTVGATISCSHKVYCLKGPAQRFGKRMYTLLSRRVTFTVAKVTEKTVIATDGRRFHRRTLVPVAKATIEIPFNETSNPLQKDLL